MLMEIELVFFSINDVPKQSQWTKSAFIKMMHIGGAPIGLFVCLSLLSIICSSILK